jgi:hypothetical protein
MLHPFRLVEEIDGLRGQQSTGLHLVCREDDPLPSRTARGSSRCKDPKPLAVALREVVFRALRPSP